jgi:hypothetical protein
MKSLDQVEPRIPVDVTHTPGDSNSTYIISQPGSYYLTGNLVGESGKTGISIQADFVTLDLNGFQLAGGGGTSSGINGVNNVHTRIFNGTVSGWGSTGIVCGSEAMLDHISSFQNGAHGIVVATRSIICDCKAHSNGGDGIALALNCRISNCISTNNVVGIDGTPNSNGSIVDGCVAYANSSSGINLSGECIILHCDCVANGGPAIQVGSVAQIRDCVVGGNFSDGLVGGSVVEISDCVFLTNRGTGVTLADHCYVTRCHVNDSGADGIVVGSISVVENCSPDFQTNGAGIRTAGNQNRIEGNHVTRNLTGILVTGTENLIVKNSSSKSSPASTNYSIVAGNRYGQIVDITAGGTAAVNGNSAPATTSTSDPWANFSY